MKDIKKVNRVMEIFQLCLDIQAKGIAEIMFSFAGHVESISVRIYAPEWDEGINPVRDWLSEDIFLDSMKNDLEDILSGKIILPNKDKLIKNKIAELKEQIKDLEK